MTESLKPNPFSKALSERQQGETERRSLAVANVSHLIEFLNSKEGVEWLKDQVKEKGKFDQWEWRSFSIGHTTGIVLQPNYEIHGSIPDLEIDLRIILEGKSNKVSRVYFGERVDACFPRIGNKEGGCLSYADLEKEEYQLAAIAKAMDQAVKDRPQIANHLDRFFKTQGGDCECPFICFVSKHYSPDQLVDELGIGEAERLCSGFERAIQEG